jgi:hypothetical protein
MPLPGFLSFVKISTQELVKLGPGLEKHDVLYLPSFLFSFSLQPKKLAGGPKV